MLWCICSTQGKECRHMLKCCNNFWKALTWKRVVPSSCWTSSQTRPSLGVCQLFFYCAFPSPDVFGNLILFIGPFCCCCRWFQVIVINSYSSSLISLRLGIALRRGSWRFGVIILIAGDSGHHLTGASQACRMVPCSRWPVVEAATAEATSGLYGALRIGAERHRGIFGGCCLSMVGW